MSIFHLIKIWTYYDYYHVLRFLCCYIRRFQSLRCWKENALEALYNHLLSIFRRVHLVTSDWIKLMKIHFQENEREKYWVCLSLTCNYYFNKVVFFHLKWSLLFKILQTIQKLITTASYSTNNGQNTKRTRCSLQVLLDLILNQF